MSYLLDTGFYLAMINEKDDHHNSVIASLPTINRLNITRILTIDTRHFRMFRPNHTPVFELIP